MLIKAHGEYQLRESVQIWFNEGVQTATMMDRQATPTIQKEMTTDPGYYFHYIAAVGAWEDQQALFPEQETPCPEG